MALSKLDVAFMGRLGHIWAMDERAKIITEQTLALSASEREELCLVLAASVGKPDASNDKAWFDEAEDRLASCCWAKRR